MHTITYLDQSVSNLPTEDPRIVLFVFFNFLFDFWCSNPWFASTNHSGSNTSSFLVSIQYLWYTSVRNTQLSTDDTWTDTSSSQLNNLVPDVIGQRSSVDKHSAKLVYSTLTCWTQQLEINLQHKHTQSCLVTPRNNSLISKFCLSHSEMAIVVMLEKSLWTECSSVKWCKWSNVRGPLYLNPLATPEFDFN